MGKVRVDIPASTTNLGPGFDVLGMALKLYNTVEMELSVSGLHIQVEGEGVNSLPRDESNQVYKAARMVFDRVGQKPPPMNIRLVNRIPLARGLGSSGTAAIGGLMAANVLAGADLTKEQILTMAAGIDGHPDNVAASIFGGVVIASPTDNGIAWMKFMPPKPLDIVIVVPEFQFLTKEARAMLPDMIDRKAAVFNIGRTSLLTAALATGDYRLLNIATDDMLHQPYREKKIPGMTEVFQAAKVSCPDVAVALSGAGPSIAAFCPGNSHKVGESMQQAFLKHNIKSQVMILAIDEEGAKVN